MHFLQLGALYFRADDLAKIEKSEFILPEDMARLRNIERLKLALPTRNMRLNAEASLGSSVLKIISEFFRESRLGESVSLMDTLAWFIFRRYKGSTRTPDEQQWFLATSPTTGEGITLHRAGRARCCLHEVWAVLGPRHATALWRKVICAQRCACWLHA